MLQAAVLEGGGREGGKGRGVSGLSRGAGSIESYEVNGTVKLDVSFLVPLDHVLWIGSSLLPHSLTAELSIGCLIYLISSPEV